MYLRASSLDPKTEFALQEFTAFLAFSNHSKTAKRGGLLIKPFFWGLVLMKKSVQP
jgi:hypothetical protein